MIWNELLKKVYCLNRKCLDIYFILVNKENLFNLCFVGMRDNLDFIEVIYLR